MEDETTIRALEARRCALLGSSDLMRLAALLDDGYVHVHGNGHMTDKAATLVRLETQPRHTDRGALTVTIWGDAALIVGEQVNRSIAADGAEQVTRGMVTQTLRRRGGDWRFLSLHFTSMRD